MYKVILNWKIVPFNNYSEALAFKNKYGGKIYQKIGSYNFN